MIDPVSGSPTEYTVEGTTFAPTGVISTFKGQALSGPELQTESVVRLAEISALCNDSKVVYNEVCRLPVVLQPITDRFHRKRRPTPTSGSLRRLP